MLEVKSFCSHHSMPDNKNVERVVNEATYEANEYVEVLNNQWDKVQVASTSTQLVIEGISATYVITLVLEMQDFIRRG
jgi:hypothetical protein